MSLRTLSAASLALVLACAHAPAQLDTALYIDASSTHLPASMYGRNMGAGAADFTGDGRPELVIAREFATNGLFFNNGAGLMRDSTAGRLPLPVYDSEEVAIADFDGDGFLDIVFASEDNMVHEYYLNNGNNTFRDVSSRLPQSVGNAVVAIDLNADNAPDLVFGNAGQDFLLMNNGDGTFADSSSSWLPPGLEVTQDIAFGDIDDDGDLDMIVGNEDGNKILIRVPGRFVDQTSTRLPSANEETRKVTLGDVDGDGDLDIFFSNVAFIPGRNPQDRLLINNGNGVFADETVVRLPADGEHTLDAAFIDVDFDGDLDLITANIFFNRPVKALLNDSTGVFEERTSSVLPPGVTAEGIGIVVDDFNGDGLKDLFIVNRRTPQQPTTHDWLLLRKSHPTGVNQGGVIQPEMFRLQQNFPNPFNPTTRIVYRVESRVLVDLRVFDVLAREVATLVNEVKEPGEHAVTFDAAGFASGVYLYRMHTGRFSETRKLVVLR